jgi:uncharacterized protein (TIGR03085 family)
MSEGRALQVRGRAALCDTLESVGADAPTMCEGWRALDLAAHLSVRENDSWTAPVIVCGQLSGLVARMVARERALGFAKIVARLRSGPPWLFRSTPLTVRLNTVEDWIHHEDVRRANGMVPRVDGGRGGELDDVLWRGVSSAGKVTGLRLDDVGLEAVSSIDGRRHTVKKGARVVSVIGPPGEVLLFVTGRTSVAQVSLEGPDDAVDAMRRARLNL